MAHIFGVRVTKRLRGKLSSVLEKLELGHHAMRIYCKNLVGRMYEKFSTFLRVEVYVNLRKDLGLNKGSKNLEALRRKLVPATDRLAGFEALIPERSRRLPFAPADRSAGHGRQN